MVGQAGKLPCIKNIDVDFGKKISVPKDIMLEELSLLSNRGSRLFKKRQRRSEKYTFEGYQNSINSQMNSYITSQTHYSEGTENGKTVGNELEVGQQHTPKTPPNTPDPRTPPNPDAIAPGYTGPLKEIPPEKFNSTVVPKSYQTPWEEAIASDPELVSILQPRMLEVTPKTELPEYKTFNRVATPYGGFDKASKALNFKIPKLDFTSLEPELRSPLFQDGVSPRPSFNRTAQGWTSINEPTFIDLSMDIALPETDDL
ncbi:myozenin-2 isoform X2 [Callorhinchus milii]|uniref:Myozenin 2 n=1 Tax=Callorhinchus milii TaxID=7868 RepID=A0A4W3GQT2_CALMI|nr:myozenin-2 isoform X2 [Callorhinchus milii]|eukprot:gi/632948610/ref/XP_007889689.1/ PREDICTED: myozenin-2 isoform X2 [Callorhinchus milii]